MLNYDQNNQSQSIQIQITNDNQCIINSIPYTNQIMSQKFRKNIPSKNYPQNSKNSIDITNKFPNEELNLSLSPSEKNSTEKKKDQTQNKNENEENLLLSFSHIFDTSKTSTNSLIFNKDQSKEISTGNYYDKTPVNEINITPKVNNDNSTNTNTKKNLNQLFNNISGEKKTPLKYLKNQIQNKIEDDYLNYDIYNQNCGKIHKNYNTNEMSDNDNKINLFTKYEMDNDISDQNISNNKKNININITPSTNKNNSQESISDFFSNKNSNNNNKNDKDDKNEIVSEFCIENLININIENSTTNKNENNTDTNKQKRIFVNRANFKELKLKSKNRTCSTIGINNFNVFLNGIENNNNNINNNLIQNINNNNKTSYHNYVDMSNNKQQLINSPGNSNTDTVIHVSNPRKSIKIDKKILINEQENVLDNIQLKTDRIGTNNLKLTLSNESSYNKKNITNNKKKFSITHQMKDKLKILLEKHKDYLSKNDPKNKYLYKPKVKDINSNFSQKTLNAPLTSRITYSNKNFNISNNSLKSNSKILKKTKKKISSTHINKNHFISNCSDNKKLKKIFNKSSKNLTSSQKTLNNCNHKKIINNYLFKNNESVQNERNSCINGLYNDYSSLLSNKSGIISVNKINKTNISNRNINKKNNKQLNSYNNFISNTTRFLNGASRKPTKIIQNFNFYNKKKNYRKNNPDIINLGLNLDNSENISIFANSITDSN